MGEVVIADSHITEPANCYVDYIEAAWKDEAPRLVAAAVIYPTVGSCPPCGAVRTSWRCSCSAACSNLYDIDTSSLAHAG